ncbi:MAG: hypothetical protein K8S87_03810, partial [Planctomycetes bacterium]|nr:hypothetical protein [Planctomycetota bacterium]
RYRGREHLTLDGCSFDDSFNTTTGHNVWTCGSNAWTPGYNALTFTNWTGVGGGATYEFEDPNPGGAGTYAAGTIGW